MAGQIDEEVLTNFIVSEDDFRDLDSIVRRHCQDVKYYVYRGSALGGYDTDDLEVLLKERNGSGAKIVSVMLHAAGSGGLKFNVDFHDVVGVNGESEDRARLVLLATEARGLIQDRMKGVTPQRRNILYAVALIFLFVGYLAFQQHQISYANNFNAAQTNKVNMANTAYLEKDKAAIVPTQSLLSQAVNALSEHDLSAEIGALLQEQIQQWRQQVIYSAEPTVSTKNPPTWSTSYWLAVAVGCAAATLSVGIVRYLVIPGSGSVFLIGDGKQRQERSSKRRTLIIQGIGLALIVGIAASLIASFVPLRLAFSSQASTRRSCSGSGSVCRDRPHHERPLRSRPAVLPVRPGKVRRARESPPGRRLA